MCPAPKYPKAAMESASLSSASPQENASRDRTPHRQRALITGAMQLFNGNLNVRLPLTDPAGECATHLLQKLFAIDLLRPAPEITRLHCPLCANPSVEPKLPAKGEYEFYCDFCQADVDMPDESYKLLALSLPTLFGLLTKAFHASRHEKPWEMLDGHLWEIGEFVHDGQPVNLLFARVDGLDADIKIDACLKSMPPSYRCLVLLSRKAYYMKNAQIRARRIVVVLSDVATLDMDGVHPHDLQALLSMLDAAGETSLQPGDTEIEADTKGEWVRINGVTTYVRGKKQRRFVMAMMAALHKGDRQPLLEDILTTAGYSEGITDVRHTSRRPDFRMMFGYGNGRVWFKAPATL